MRGSASAFDDGFALALEMGLPEDEAAEVAGSLCCSPYGEGPCSEESKAQIKQVAETTQGDQS